MPRKKIFDKGYVNFSVKISREVWSLMRGPLSFYDWPVIIRSLINAEVSRLKELKDISERLIKPK